MSWDLILVQLKLRTHHYCNISEDPRLCYSIREQICVGVWPNPKGFESRNFANNLYIKSRCIDASKLQYSHADLCDDLISRVLISGLVIDGSIAYPFNDGTKSLLEVLPEDALLTIKMKE